MAGATVTTGIVFENAVLVAVDKPAGVLTVPSRQGAADVRPVMGRQLEGVLGIRLWPVHRLDYEASGLVIFAKSAESHRVASSAFERRRVCKNYEALTEGADRIATLPASFVWQSRLVRGKKRSFEAPHGKLAVTRARAIARVQAAAFVRTIPDVVRPSLLLRWWLEPETGRPHQLRVHLARAGFPIAGDRLYGAQTIFKDSEAIALRAVRLEFLDEDDRRALQLTGALEIAGFAGGASP
jgi:tRNA pseudouridine32 synthase / 23S rRNA pseudouridine746 synthase